MKKLITIVLAIIIMTTSLPISFANGSLSKVSLKEDGKGKNYQVVNIKIDGKVVKSADVPPIIYPLNNQGRTLVPLRMIIEHLQDKLKANIQWDGPKQEVKIKNDQKEIILKINSPIALVNGLEKKLPDNIPAKLLVLGDAGRTMVPVRFFAEEFGININWDDKTLTASLELPKQPEKKPEQEGEQKPNTELPNDEGEVAEITDVQVISNGSIPQIRIKVSKKVDIKEFKLINPDRLVIDLNNARFNISNRNKLEPNGTLSIKPNGDIIKDIRVAQFQNDPFVTRIVMELSKSTEYEISFDETSGEILIDFNNYIRNVRKEVINGKEVITIQGDSIEDYTMFQLADPERLVIDIKDGVLHNNFKNKVINIDGKVAKAVRVSQFDSGNGNNEKAVRVVIDLKALNGYREFYGEIKDNKLIIHLEGEPLKSIQYEEIGWTTSKLIFKGSNITRYDVERQLGTNIIEVLVHKNDIDLEMESINIDDHIIKYINIEEDRNKDYYNIKIELQDFVEYRILSSIQTQDLILELNNKNAKYREKLIIIDPGHGGSDPGTISSILKIYESEIVLDIAKRLNSLLTEAGFRTYMTRVDNLNKDIKLSLQDRVDVANALNADLFVSIHANAALTDTAKGLENYYYPTEKNPLDNRDNKKLADIFQSEMIKNLDTNNRGSKPQEYFVLKNTTMPAVLTETGFLSNPEDEAKLATPEYRIQVAEAIFKSIVRYFEETK